MDSLEQRIATYSNNPLFADAKGDEVFLSSSPYQRPTRTFDNSYINFSSPLSLKNQTSNSALSVHRMLLNIYEAGCLYLPERPNETFSEDFHAFYSYENTLRGELIRADLERKAYSFLAEEIRITGDWSCSRLLAFLEDFSASEKAIRQKKIHDGRLFETILASSDPERCARHYLVQMAPDFLSEASAMARYASGAYGEVQSSLFNILIDEYGASVHQNKHSSLFENTLRSVDLHSTIHYYWQFYHATSLSLTNYFHYVTLNKVNFFRYLGALFYTECSLANTTRRQSAMLRSVFGSKVDTTYFDEHTHIDQHHGMMALDRLIRPTLERFGDAVVESILRGFLEFRLLEEIADNDLIAQFQFFDQVTGDSGQAKETYERMLVDNPTLPLETFVECQNERSTTHVHPDDRLLVIESGTMDFWPLMGTPLSFGAGDVRFIPRHRIHGSVVTSAECVYHQPIAESVVVDPPQLPC